MAVTLIVTLPDGSVVGGVYVVTTPLGVTPGDTVPQVPDEQETVQLTPALPESLATVATSCSVDPACTVAVFGETATEIAGGGGGGELGEPPPQALSTAPKR